MVYALAILGITITGKMIITKVVDRSAKNFLEKQEKKTKEHMKNWPV